MSRAQELWVTCAVVGVCALAVALQLASGDSDERSIAAMALGDVLRVDFALAEAASPPRARNLMNEYGRRATVIMTWSVPCPCIEALEPRLAALHERFGDRAGIAWVAIDGEPGDTAEAVAEKRGRVKAFYRVLLDPEQRVCRRLGLVHAAMVAVLDGEGRLVYRGSVDGDYEAGRAEHLAEALEAVAAGRPVPAPERSWVYGCEFAVPESCLEYAPPSATAGTAD
jgi:hypothetical protein